MLFIKAQIINQTYQMIHIQYRPHTRDHRTIHRKVFKPDNYVIDNIT